MFPGVRLQADSIANTGGEAFISMNIDAFYLLCAEIRRQCDASVIKDGEYREENRAACRKALARFDAELEPALARILDASGKDSPAGREAREEAAFCLHELAKNHIWAEEYDTSERLIARAKEMALSSSQVLSRIEETVSSLAANAAQRSATQNKATLWEEPAKPAAPSTGSARKWWPQAAAAAVAIIVAVGISYKLGWKSAERQQEIAAKPATTTTAAPAQEEKATPVKAAPEKEAQQPVAPSARESSKKSTAKSEPEKTEPTKSEIEKPLENPGTARAKAVLRQKHIHTGKSAARSSEARKLSIAAGVYKKARGGKVTTESLRPRIMAGLTALAALEERLAQLMQQLDDMEKGFERYWAAVEGNDNQIPAGEQVDTEQYRRTLNEYRANVRRYYKLLEEASLTADEHDSVLRQTWRLVGRYRKLTVG